MFSININKRKFSENDIHSMAVEKLVSKIVDSILHQLKTDQHFKKKLTELIMKEAREVKKGEKK